MDLYQNWLCFHLVKSVGTFSFHLHCLLIIDNSIGKFHLHVQSLFKTQDMLSDVFCHTEQQKNRNVCLVINYYYHSYLSFDLNFTFIYNTELSQNCIILTCQAFRQIYLFDSSLYHSFIHSTL